MYIQGFSLSLLPMLYSVWNALPSFSANENYEASLLPIQFFPDVSVSSISSFSIQSNFSLLSGSTIPTFTDITYLHVFLLD